jgi:hypothetical protein
MNLDFINPMSWLNSFLRSLCEGIVLSSYWICLIGGLIGLILYIFGYEKGKKAPMLSIAIYLIINIIGRVILSV